MTGIEPYFPSFANEPAPIYQLELPAVPRAPLSRPVNVSSIPQLSPFRYPGGKTWLIPTIREWLQDQKPKRLFEPFGGGSIVSLTAAFEGLADEVIFCELDKGVAAVWETVLSSEWEWLADQILSFNVTEENVRAMLNRTPRTNKQLAFQTILRNRVQRGGIMAPGAGLVKAGENGKGLLSRWYPTTLANRLKAIHGQKNKLTFLSGNAFQHWSKVANSSDVAIYVDPPYVKASKRLYSHWEVPHREIFRLSRDLKARALLSYDNTPEVVAWAKEFGFSTRPISMKNAHHATMNELLIGQSLDWLDDQMKFAA